MTTTGDVSAGTAVDHALGAWPGLRKDAGRRAGLLDALAAGLEAARGGILAKAVEETSLTTEELTPEFARMTGTLRLFAGAVREGSWVRAAIDHATPPPGAAVVGPAHDLRRMLVPLGPVAVFGASNFPLAYGVCGGDTASALAAGCPVIVKEHPAHPQTGRLIAATARQAAVDAGFGHGVLGYLTNEDPRDLSVAAALVQHPCVAAVGFTGSVRAGLGVQLLAMTRATPIPAYCEMGSVNPVLVTPGALQARGVAIGAQLADSILLRFGQQCTCPGITAVPAGSGALVETLCSKLVASPPRTMLAPWVRDGYLHRLHECAGAGGVTVLARGPEGSGPRQAGTCVMRVSLADYAAQPVLHEEVFGPAVLIVDLPEIEAAVSMPLRGSLVGSLYAEPGEFAGLGRVLADALTRVCGRVAFNGVPTGVRAATAMVHGGPYASTNRPESTACGPLALERWCRPVCWQNAPADLLPDEVREGNPRGVWRTVDGVPGR